MVKKEEVVPEVPAAQLIHMLAPAAENVPARQLAQLNAPAAEYVFDAQSKQGDSVVDE